MPGTNGHTPKAYNAGVWKDWNAVQGNLNGTWRLASDVFVRHNNEWKKVWVRLTAPTAGSSSISHVTATISWTPGVGQDGFKLYRNGVFVKDVIGANTTTDTVPAMQTNYAYTVSSFAGVTESAQIACGTVSAQVPGVTAFITINRDWAYSNSTWDNQPILFNASCSAATNATGYQYSNDNGASVAFTGGNYVLVSSNQNLTYPTVWRAYINYNGVNYFGAWSNTVTIYAGRPLVRNAPENANYNQTVRGITTVGETVDFGAFGVVVDSYQFRVVNVVGSSLLANSTRRVTFRRPAGAGGDIVIPYGSSPTSGTSDDGGNYQQGPFTNYVPGFYGLSTIGAGWPGAPDEPYVTYTLRFTVRSIAQGAIAYSIS